jgi:hypothetical protein
MDDGATLVRFWCFEEGFPKIFQVRNPSSKHQKCSTLAESQESNDHTDLGPENKRYFCLKDG